MTEQFGSEAYDRIFNIVKTHMKWDNGKTDLWFNTNNPLIGLSTPRNFYCRRPEKCISWIESLVDENIFEKNGEMI